MGRHETLSTGLVTGAAGAAAMMAVAMLGAATQELRLLHPAMVLGESFVGPEAFEAVGAKVAFGLLVHLVTSVGLGIILASILPRDFPMASAIGVGVGFVLLSFMFVLMPLVVPLAHPGFRSGMQGMGGTWIVALAVFGGILGTGPALRRWAARSGPHRRGLDDAPENRPATDSAGVRRA
jgi:hypothetical protein